MPPDDQDDELKRWLSQQQAPNLDAPQPAAAQQPGVWQRAAQMLGAGNYGSEPAPKANDIGWKTVLGMVLSKDPGGVLLADADVKRRQIDDWARRNSPEAMYERQRQLAGMVMQEDAAKRAAEAQQFEQDRATANDIERANEVEYRHGRDQVGDQHWTAEQKRAAEQFDATQSGMDRRQALLLANQRGMNDADNAAALARAQLAQGAQAAREARLDANAARAETKMNAQLGREFNKDTDSWRQIAQQVDDLDAIIGKYKPGTLPGIGLIEGSDTLQSWRAIRDNYFSDPKKDGHDMRYAEDARAVVAAKNRMAELLQRKESGAAGPISEKDRYMIAAGSRPNATESEFKTGLQTMRKLAGMEISSFASGREEPARAALKAGGLEKWAPPPSPEDDPAKKYGAQEGW